MMRKNRFLLAFVLISFLTLHLAASENEGKLLEVFSPRTLGTGAGSASMLAPNTSMLNPAAAALTQRLTFDGSYVGIIGSDETSSGWKGHAVNFGHTIPTKVGVFSWNSSFINSSFDTLDTGSQFRLSGSFAKDIYPDTFIGVGLKTAVAGGPQYTAAADLGLIRSRSSLFVLDDVYWSLVLQNMGYSNVDSLRPPMYNVSAGVDGRLFQKGKLTGRLMSDIAWLELDNLRWSTGIQLQVGESFHASMATRVDFRKIFDGNFGELIPSLSLSYTYVPGDSEGERWTQNELQPYVAAAPLSDSLWVGALGLSVPIGRIDNEAPEIEIDLSDVLKQYAPRGEEGESRNTIDGEAGEEGEQDHQAQPEGGDDTAESSGEESLSKRAAPKSKSSALAAAPMSLVADRKSGNKALSEGLSAAPGIRIAQAEAAAPEGASEQEGQSETPSEQNTAGEAEEESRVKTSIDEFSEQELANEIPEAQIYLSPNNDGVLDDLSFPFSLSESRYIKGYEFIVEDQDGNPIRTIVNKETRPEQRTFRSFFKNLFASKSGIQVPDTLRWDGTSDSGEVAPDGLYYFYVRAWDDNENYGSSDRYSVYIDTQPPVVEIEKSSEQERIFSPNNDGNKDVLPIMQSGTREDEWTARIENTAGAVVKEFRWSDSKPKDIQWDGTNEDEILVPDGVYQYLIESTDRAGNRGSAEYVNLVKNTEPTPIALTIDHSHFSPNGDNVLDTLLLQPEVPVIQGVDHWLLEIKDSAGKVRRSYSGKSAPTGAIAFDGKDNQSKSLPEGVYTAEMEVVYVNGNNPKAESAAFTIDVTPPSARVNIDTKIFSPNGDGNQDAVTINQETSLEENWYGTITDIDENIVYQYKWIERAESSITWDGRNESGALMDDGYYFYQLSTVDRAGNPGESRRIRVELNTEETEVILTNNLDYFSPNGDGTKDVLELQPRLKGSRRVKDFRLSIENEAGEVQYVRSGTGDVPESFQWDGFSNEGERVADGGYTAELLVTNLNGNQNTAATKTFYVDTVAPSADIRPEYTIFSPEGDGNRDTLTIYVENSSREELWEGQIVAENGNIIHTSNWNGRPRDFEWDGTDNSGNRVADGSYSYMLFSTDRAGNSVEVRSPELELDTQPTKLFVTADKDKLSPNGDGTYEEISFSTIVNRPEGLESWSLEMVDRSGKVQKSFQGDSRIPQKIIWKGENNEGRIVESEYKARFRASYRKGNRPVAESLPFILDVTPPSSDVSISPIPFSPDNDGADDELRISLRVRDANEIAGWSFTIFDAERNAGGGSADGPIFRSYSGKGSPADEIIWDGRSDNGELVYAAMDYPYRFEVEDSLGNIAVERGKIPIDVLVIREGDLLKIKIANINFKPNEAEFVDDDPALAERNEYVLNRLAEILKKYRQYEITIQGHANVTRYWDAEAAKEEQMNELLPLSEQRAQRVLEALAERGISRDRLNAEGVGGNQPLVPFDDAENRWKNRRVEFILEKD